jgi:mRNA-degrading endonuclease toxin of MazEF toxin-antitoxin module
MRMVKVRILPPQPKYPVKSLRKLRRNRGDVFLAKLGPTQGSKTDHERAVVVARGTRKTALPSKVVLKAGEGGLAEESLALGEQVRSIRTARFTKQLGPLVPHSVTAIGAALNIALDL